MCTWGWRTCSPGASRSIAPRTFSIAVNDYGFELLCAQRDRLARAAAPGAGAGRCARSCCTRCSRSLNASELAQRRFREIARVSGLVFQGYPGEKRSNKQLQASSSLFYEVFRKYDPANRLLLQAEQELLAQELEIGRLRASLVRMAAQRLVVQTLERPTPFAFPLMVERFREKLSNEKRGRPHRAHGGAARAGSRRGAWRSGRRAGPRDAWRLVGAVGSATAGQPRRARRTRGNV